jgi:hypothetical protein
MEGRSKPLPARLLVAGAALGLLVASACTRSPGGDSAGGMLFEPAGDAGALEAMAADVQGAPVKVDAAVVDKEPDALRVRTPKGVKTVRKARVERRGAGNLSWFGRTEGEDADDVVVTVVNGSVAAKVGTGDGAVSVNGGRLRKLEGEAFTAEKELLLKPGETMESGLRRHAQGRYNVDEAPATAAIAQAQAEAGPPLAEAPLAAQADGGLPAPNIVDVMVLYSPDISGFVNEARIQNIIDAGNMAFYASHVGIQYRLVHTEQVDKSWMPSVYGLMTNPSVQALRNQYRADLVQAWGDNNWNFCGQGYQNQGGAAAGYGYSVIKVNPSYRLCIDNYIPPLHEFGHNLGAAHDKKNTQAGVQAGAAADAYGYIPPGGQFSTIMAYDGPPCPRNRCAPAFVFSNPEVSFKGIPTGRVGQENNAAAIHRMGATIAAYR